MHCELLLGENQCLVGYKDHAAKTGEFEVQQGCKANEEHRSKITSQATKAIENGQKSIWKR